VNPDHSLEDIRWLIGSEAGQLLHQLSIQRSSLVADAERLQRQHSRARVRLLLEQVELRRKAVAKFPDAAKMFFLAQTLEQATDIHVARYKAGRFPTGQRVADLCCGLGGDSIALAERGPITAVDRDEATILLAEANLRNLTERDNKSSPHKFHAGDVTEFSVDSFAAWHLDPDRRASGRRTTQLASYAPGLETIERLRSECEEGVVKLAPATDVPESWQEQAELEWIGRDRQCRQQVAWFGGLARSPGLRRATVLRMEPGESATIATIVGHSGIRSPVSEQVGRYVFEPDATVLAAELAGALAQQYGLEALHPAVPYYTGDEAIDDPILQCFETTDVLPFDRKRLRKVFRERGVGRLEIKTRGIEERPEQIRRDLKLRGDGDAVLLLARLGRRVTAIVAKRV
jgi:SAM-dependent methyltransferase